MGEVWRATDTKLGRDVAIKILPDSFATDPDRLARLTHEARVLASLNHPNIAVLYGVEERALILELVEGPTLAERLARGPLPLAEALSVARQIAEALEWAHEKGIIHRDLKPANIKLTREGRVKVLDFGLAKAFGTGINSDNPDLSPTLSVNNTAAGAISGTAAYMAPEQARGAAVDKRADLWAFGVVLYEMITGRQAFGSRTVTETLAAVLKTDPDWTALTPELPPSIQRLLHRCLQKDPRRRLRDVGDAVIEIDEARQGPAETTSAVLVPSWSRLPWALTAFLALLSGLLLWAWRLQTPASPRPVMRWNARLFRAITTPGISPAPVLSSDGTQLAYLGYTGTWSQILVRRTDQLEAHPITGSDPVDYVGHFFSPDGRWMAYRSLGKLKKVATVGGPSMTLASAPLWYGGSWAPDNTLVLGHSMQRGLWRIPAEGGRPEEVTSVDAKAGETEHDWPYFLPGSTVVLFSARTTGSWDDARIEAVNLRTRSTRVVLEGGTSPRYAASGHLIYERGGSLFAVAFDPGKLQVKGSPVRVLEGVYVHRGTGFAAYSFSEAGDLVYVPSTAQEEARTLVWVNRKGMVEPVPAPARWYGNPSLSPEGRRIALDISTGSEHDWDIWVYHLGHGTLTRLTFGAVNLAPIWTPDGKRITFRHVESGKNGIYSIPADGSGPAEQLLSTEAAATPCSWTPDGRSLVYYQGSPLATEVRVLPVGVHTSGALPSVPRTLIASAAVPQLSPNGRWIAYASSESGRAQVYVQSFTGAGGKWQISVDSGYSPRWARSGRELFYRNAETMMAVDVETQSAFRFGTPRPLFAGGFEGVPQGWQPGAGYDISPDGTRFLMVKSGSEERASGEIEVVHNWFEELRQLVPVSK